MAQGVIRGYQSVWLAKEEATYGTDPTPTPAANGLFTSSFTIEPTSEFVPMPRLSASLSSYGMARSAAFTKFTITAPWTGVPAGAPDIVSPNWEALIEAGMFHVTTDGPPITTRTYAPNSIAAQKSLTHNLYVYGDDGTTVVELHQILGAVHNWTLDYEAGKEMMLTCEGEGIYVSPTNPAVPAGLAYVHPDESFIGRGATFTIAGNSYNIEKLTITPNWSIDRMPAFNATDAYARFNLTRTPETMCEGSMMVEAQPASTRNVWTDAENETTGALSLVADSNKGSRLTVAAALTQLLAPKPTFTGAMSKYDIPLVFRQQTAAGDDYLSLALSRTP